MSTFDCFLAIDGIPGESQDSKHVDEIDVLTFSWAESQAAPVQSGLGAGVGRVHIQDLEVTARTSKASPKLMLACASGAHFASARLTCRAAGVGDTEFLVMTLSRVLVSGYHIAGMAGGDGALPTDQITLNFKEIKIEYRQRRVNGSLDNPAITAEWDVQEDRGG
jgi:type VI secretion system secreted protein Hcp